MTTTPKNTWQQGEYPTATELNKFSTALDEIHAILGDVALNYAVPAEVSSGEFTLFHKYRWLFFRSVGVIVDPSGVGDDVSISEADSGTSKYDLDSVSWLVYGARYVVTGVSFCGESEA